MEPDRSDDVPTPFKLTPEFLEWARNQFTDAELVAGLREIRETGGLTFEQVVRGLADTDT